MTGLHAPLIEEGDRRCSVDGCGLLDEEHPDRGTLALAAARDEVAALTARDLFGDGGYVELTRVLLILDAAIADVLP